MTKTKKTFVIIGIILLLVILIQLINAAKYKMVVNVVEGENVMGINPLTDKLDFGDLSRNNGMIRYITLNNKGGLPLYIAVFRFGEISDLVKVDRNYFTLEAGKEIKLSFEIKIPPSAKTKQYSGWVIIFRLPRVI